MGDPITLEPLYSLADLRRLCMSSNNVGIDFDDVSNFTPLSHLDLSATGLSGAVPPSISACKNLRFLALDQNQLDTLPAGMSDLVNLQFLSLANNSFTDPFPTEELGNLHSLVSLDLSSNSFGGSIPSLAHLTNHLVVKLDNNNFTGFEQPLFIGPQSLQQLSISNNQLEGTIPSAIPTLENLRLLDMSGNKLSGEIPAGFYRLLNASRSVHTLDFSQNQLKGQIPTDLLLTGQVPNDYFPYVPLDDPQVCAFVNLSHNLLAGNIPIHGNDTSLNCFNALDLSYNNLSGPVPSNIFSNAFSSVSSLLLNDNQLSGDMIDIFLDPGFQSTSEVRMGNNTFTGDLSRMTTLAEVVLLVKVIDLNNNCLQWSTSESLPDPISATLEVLTSVSITMVGGNNFSGTPFPSECFLNNLHNNFLTVLDLSNSQLEGEIFGAAFDNNCLPSLLLLNLSNNHATGQLSQDIVIHELHLIVYVSNDLSGPVPVIPGSNEMYNPKYLAGNDGLCGEPLTPCAQRTGVQWWVLLIIVAGSVTIALGNSLAATWRLRVYHRQHQHDADLIRTLLERDSATLMPLRDLKKATITLPKVHRSEREPLELFT